jgi:hypothetical protein
MKPSASGVAALIGALENKGVRVTCDEDLESRSLNVYWGDGPGIPISLDRRLRKADRGKVIGYCRSTGRVSRPVPAKKRRVA